MLTRNVLFESSVRFFCMDACLRPPSTLPPPRIDHLVGSS